MSRKPCDCSKCKGVVVLCDKVRRRHAALDAKNGLDDEVSLFVADTGARVVCEQFVRPARAQLCICYASCR